MTASSAPGTRRSPRVCPASGSKTQCGRWREAGCSEGPRQKTYSETIIRNAIAIPSIQVICQIDMCNFMQTIQADVQDKILPTFTKHQPQLGSNSVKNHTRKQKNVVFVFILFIFYSH